MPADPSRSGTTPTPRAALSRARWATRAQFLNLGVAAGSWGVHVPSVKAHYRLDESTLALVLLATSVGSLLTLTIAGRIVGRLGARTTSLLAGWGFCAALALSLLVPGLWVLLPVMLCFGASESIFDVSINAEGTTLETLSGRSVMSGFHGMFSLGAMAGAASSALMIRASVPAAWQLGLMGGAIAVSILVASRGMLESHPVSDGPQSHFTWPHGTLLLIGALICFGMLAEGVMYNWSVLYVNQELHAPQERAALAYVAFAGATALMRFAGDAVRDRVSERTMLLSGPTIAAVAMLVVLLVARPWVAMVGFAVVGMGLATVVPILYNAATRVPGVSRAAAIASVSSIGYVGFMIGPPIIGGIAHATTLTIAMGTLTVACAVLVAGARRVPESKPEPVATRTHGTLAPHHAGN
ncbi:MAG: MFS transporter [Gemmatimonadaceae bacterium]|nr:MFS transporter [Gemmatimonadaceae bacterium]